ncbi:MAG: S26 family signal peptidase, partial [Gemmatimonadaceae bacterium]
MPVPESSDAGSSAAPRSITPAQRVEALRELNRGRTTLDFFVDWLKILVVSILMFAVIRTFFVEAFKIPSGSMENTLQVGDFLLVNKLIY